VYHSGSGTRQIRCGIPDAHRFGQVGGEFAVSVAEQQRQMDALKTLDAGLSSAALLDPAAFEVRTQVTSSFVPQRPFACLL